MMEKEERKNLLMINKLSTSRGESLVEVLVALLLAAFSLTMLAGMVTASVRMVRNSRETLEKYYNQTEVIANSISGDSPSIMKVKASINAPLDAGEGTVLSDNADGDDVICYYLNSDDSTVYYWEKK